MLIVRYRVRDRAPRAGVVTSQGLVHDLSIISTAHLLALTVHDLRARVEDALLTSAAAHIDDVMVCSPVEGRTEVWAAGVTYLRSQVARMEESSVYDVYARVYDAPRPELFFKSVAWRTVGDGEAIGIRPDSEVNVPEPELALVVNASGETVGYTICNDVSSRTIEGANPLYLPQAKIYEGSCALGPGIRPAWEVVDPDDLTIDVAVIRSGTVVWSGTTSTNRMHRSTNDLIAYLFAANSFPSGVVLATGTGLVPDLDFTLRVGDSVRIDIERVGQLINHVVSAASGLVGSPDGAGA
jgi:2-dehydro-3-deoxy-D-arabinonate dehydratase